MAQRMPLPSDLDKKSSTWGAQWERRLGDDREADTTPRAPNGLAGSNQTYNRDQTGPSHTYAELIESRQR